MNTDVLIKNAIIVNSKSSFNGKQLDILIKKGNIEAISKNINSEGTTIIEAADLHVSPGWFDTQVNFGDPGFEHKEDLNSGISCAIAGGFTHIATMPNTIPVVDSKSGIEYLLNKSKDSIATIHPVGAISEKMEGKNIAELYDMHNSGAIAFSDNKQSIQNPELLKRALLYCKPFGATVINFPNDGNLMNNGHVNEGLSSTKLGLKGIPNLAEELMVARDIFLTEYTEGKLHFSTISTKKSVDLIRKAKADGLNITCSVAVANLIMNDTEIEEFDSNYKTLPPLRTNKDIDALWAGLKDGTIDCITSDHTPQNEELKKKEFDLADFGILGLETAFSSLNTANKLSTVELVDKLSTNPKAIFGIEDIAIEIGARADLTLFSTTEKWTYDNSKSKSSNSPLFSTEFTGKIFGVVSNGQLV